MAALKNQIAVMHIPDNCALSLGPVSPWGRHFLQSLQNSHVVELSYEFDVEQYVNYNSETNALNILLIENQPGSHSLISRIKKSRTKNFIVWYGRSFSKEDYKFSLENRIFAVFEDPRPEDPQILRCFKRLGESRENEREFSDLLRILSSLLTQMDQESFLSDVAPKLKAKLSSLKKSGSQNEFLLTTELDSKANKSSPPFRPAKDVSDALVSMADLQRTGNLWVKGPFAGQECRIDFLHGKIVSAISGDVQGLKALWRSFLWDSPRFLFVHAEISNLSFDDELNISLQHLCESGEDQRKRYEMIRKDIPHQDLRLELETSMLHKGTLLPGADFSALASVVESGIVSRIIDYNELPDVDLYESLIRLKKEGLLRLRVAQ